jgi:hypothetical protein
VPRRCRRRRFGKPAHRRGHRASGDVRRRSSGLSRLPAHRALCMRARVLKYKIRASPSAVQRARAPHLVIPTCCSSAMNVQQWRRGLSPLYRKTVDPVLVQSLLE